MLIFSDRLKINDIIQSLIKDRRSMRDYVFSGALKFIPGDVIVVVFWVKNYIYRFEGICICLRKKKFCNTEVTLILRNVIMSIGIEFIVSYYFNRIFFLSISDYKRKLNIYKKSKLYYIRYKLNKNSRIK